MLILCTFTYQLTTMKKQSTRLEFTKSEMKQIKIAADSQHRSMKKFMELTIIAATLQTLNSHV